MISSTAIVSFLLSIAQYMTWEIPVDKLFVVGVMNQSFQEGH
jgi:hypothetical protein